MRQTTCQETSRLHLARHKPAATVARASTKWPDGCARNHEVLVTLRGIHAPVIPRPSVIAGLTRNLVILRSRGNPGPGGASVSHAQMRLWLYQGQVQGVGKEHQPGGATVCVGQPAQGEEKADGDQTAARVGEVQGRGAPENSVAGENRAT